MSFEEEIVRRSQSGEELISGSGSGAEVATGPRRHKPTLKAHAKKEDIDSERNRP